MSHKPQALSWGGGESERSGYVLYLNGRERSVTETPRIEVTWMMRGAAVPKETQEGIGFLLNQTRQTRMAIKVRLI